MAAHAAINDVVPERKVTACTYCLGGTVEREGMLGVAARVLCGPNFLCRHYGAEFVALLLG